MLRIQATFTGEDTLGYEHGKDYLLYIQKLNGLTTGSTIQIWRGNWQGGYCGYRNIETFLANWNNIQVIPEKSV